MFDCDTRSYLARVEALDDDAVLVELVLGLHPLRFALFSGQGTDYGLTFLRVKESLYWRKRAEKCLLQKEFEGIYSKMFYPLRMERFGGEAVNFGESFLQFSRVGKLIVYRNHLLF